MSRHFFRGSPVTWFNGAGALTAPGSWAVFRERSRSSMRTGGPDPDDDDEAALVRKLLPIATFVVVVAALFG